MYAIKIVDDEATVFHEADEIVYNRIDFKDKDEFEEKAEELQPDYYTGSDPVNKDGVSCGGYFLYLKLYSNPDSSIYKKVFVRPWSIIYVMQGGKTIEVIRVDEIK